MKMKAINKKMVGLFAVLFPLLLLFFYVALRSGPLAPVPVTVVTVEKKQMSPVLFGIGTLEARYAYRIGSMASGRVKLITVDVGDVVHAGQVVGEIEPVDFDERMNAQLSAIKRAEALIRSAEAQLRDATARKEFTGGQEKRYRLLLSARAVSAEAVEAKHQEAEIARASVAAAESGVSAARQQLTSLKAEYQGLVKQRQTLLLIAPVDGLVTARQAEQGNTVLAGQTIIEMINPRSLWIDVRFDQLQSAGLKAALPARITLRSQPGHSFSGMVKRVEPLADRITEEILAKVLFTVVPEPMPPVGELCEVTVSLPPLPALPVVPDASVHRVDGRLGVWIVEHSGLRFVEVRTGMADRDGNLQILGGLQAGARVVVYSKSALHAGSRISILNHNSKEGIE